MLQTAAHLEINRVLKITWYHWPNKRVTSTETCTGEEHTSIAQLQSVTSLTFNPFTMQKSVTGQLSGSVLLNKHLLPSTIPILVYPLLHMWHGWPRMWHAWAAQGQHNHNPATEQIWKVIPDRRHYLRGKMDAVLALLTLPQLFRVFFLFKPLCIHCFCHSNLYWEKFSRPASTRFPLRENLTFLS